MKKVSFDEITKAIGDAFYKGAEKTMRGRKQGVIGEVSPGCYHLGFGVYGGKGAWDLMNEEIKKQSLNGTEEKQKF